MTIKTKFVKSIMVIDPDSKLPVQIEIRKMETGPIVGIDGSWLESDIGNTYSPYDNGIELEISDNEN